MIANTDIEQILPRVPHMNIDDSTENHQVIIDIQNDEQWEIVHGYHRELQDPNFVVLCCFDYNTPISKKLRYRIYEMAHFFKELFFYKVHLETTPLLANSFSIVAVPTFLILSNGVLLERVITSDAKTLLNAIVKTCGIEIVPPPTPSNTNPINTSAATLKENPLNPPSLQTNLQPMQFQGTRTPSIAYSESYFPEEENIYRKYNKLKILLHEQQAITRMLHEQMARTDPTAAREMEKKKILINRNKKNMLHVMRSQSSTITTSSQGDDITSLSSHAIPPLVQEETPLSEVTSPDVKEENAEEILKPKKKQKKRKDPELVVEKATTPMDDKYLIFDWERESNASVDSFSIDVDGEKFDIITSKKEKMINEEEREKKRCYCIKVLVFISIGLIVSCVPWILYLSMPHLFY